jgi:mxaJ protein
LSSVSRASAIVLFGLATVVTASADEIKVCADPNNMPFSNKDSAGFENKIMSIVADALGDKLTYVWWAQREGIISDALDVGLCDVIPGIGNVPGVLLTYPPYYRSSYVFVTRAGMTPVSWFDDPALKELKVGVQLVGNDGANPPTTLALSRRGIVDNVQGFSVLGDYAQANPPSRIVEAVAQKQIDVAVVWGPTAGYFAAQETPRLVVTPVAYPSDTAHLPMAFDISMGLRLDEGVLRLQIEAALRSRKSQIDAVLSAFHVPRLDGAPA